MAGEEFVLMWFRLFGALYILLGIGFIPAINASRLPLDFTLMCGHDLLVTGAYMLYASRDPGVHLSIVWLVVALEVVHGILDDV